MKERTVIEMCQRGIMLSKKCDLRLVDKMARGERDLSVKREAIEGCDK